MLLEGRIVVLCVMEKEEICDDPKLMQGLGVLGSAESPLTSADCKKVVQPFRATGHPTIK